MIELVQRANRLAILSLIVSLPLLVVWLLLSLNSSPQDIGTLSLPPPAVKTAAPAPLPALQQTLLKLQSVHLEMSLPDLRQELVYAGQNERPDISSERQPLYLAFKGGDIFSIPPCTTHYLTRHPATGKYALSSQNTPSALGFSASPQADGLLIQVWMTAPDGQTVCSPKERSEFILSEQPFPLSSQAFEIGKYKMDSSLLARQRARWIGPDRFLQTHGGNEFANAIGKERLEFGEGDGLYSCFVKEKDCLVWKEERWQEASGMKTEGLPLMQVKKIEERIMHLTLWEPQGKGKINLTLVKPTDPPMALKMVDDFKYIGTKSLRQWIFELKGQRILVNANDWWLQSDKGWSKLKTAKEIDDYVQRVTPGYLLVIGGVAKKGGQQVLLATLFNPPRTHLQALEIPLTPGKAVQSPGPRPFENSPLAGHKVQPLAATDEKPKDTEPEVAEVPEEESNNQMLKRPRHTRGTL